MDWLIKLFVIWFCFDVLIIATGWYGITVIKIHFPHWWRQVVADDVLVV